MTDPAETPCYVLDSYAVLAWLQGEPGAGKVTDLLRRASQGGVRLALCTVNLGEVLYIIEREESLPAAQLALATIDGLPVQQHDATREIVLQAAHAKARYRMSYADCFALALAKHLKADVITGDPEFHTQNEVELLWIGPAWESGQD